MKKFIFPVPSQQTTNVTYFCGVGTPSTKPPQHSVLGAFYTTKGEREERGERLYGQS